MLLVKAALSSSHWRVSARDSPQDVRAVAVHVHLAHVAAQTGLLQQLHQLEGCGPVNGGEDAGAGGGAVQQLLGEDAVSLFRIFRIGELALFGEGVGLQPLQQLHVHAQAPVGVLAGMHVQVHQAGQDQLAAVVLHGQVLVLLGQLGEYARHLLLHAYQIAFRIDGQLAGSGGEEDIAL